MKSFGLTPEQSHAFRRSPELRAEAAEALKAAEAAMRRFQAAHGELLVVLENATQCTERLTAALKRLPPRPWRWFGWFRK